MSHLFSAHMPVSPPRQKHGEPHVSDGYAFLRSLSGNACADVNVQWVWNQLKTRNKATGGHAMGLHGDTAASSGYTHIKDLKGHVRKMTHAEAHRKLSAWTVAGVRRWRRGKTGRGEAPKFLDELYAYVKAHGGTIVAELKSRAFATYDWIMVQLVKSAKRHNHAPWYKALANMWGVAKKCYYTIKAGGQFALIFGTHIHGRGARLAAGRKITGSWTVKPTRIW